MSAQLPDEVVAALEAEHFKADPFSHDWQRISSITGDRCVATVLNPWDRLGNDNGQLVGRMVEYHLDSAQGKRWVVSEIQVAWLSPTLASVLHEWQQTLPQDEAAL